MTSQYKPHGLHKLIDYNALSMRALALSDLGAIEHLNAVGWLIVPLVCSKSGASPSFEISNTAKVIAHEINTDASARMRPGQILHRRKSVDMRHG